VTTDPTMAQILGAAGAAPSSLSIEISDKTEIHVLHTITATVWGSRLPPCKPAILSRAGSASSPS